MEHQLALEVILVIGFLGTAVASFILLKHFRFPYTIGLVIVGFIGGLIAIHLDYAFLANLQLTPETILYLILPTLIFDASINMDIRALRMNIVPILLLAVLGLLISAGVIGGILSGFTAMTVGAALLFGALISATDPVAVIALFNEIGAPRRLVTLVDGESIFNDATAIVLFTIVISIIGSGVTGIGSLFFQSFVNFFIVLIGGIAIGGVVGLLAGLVIRWQRENLTLQITISLIVAYISFIVADLMNVSGVMSTLSAGIVMTLVSGDVIKSENQSHITSIWDYFAFVANSFVFLLLGLTEAHSFSDPSSFYMSLKLLLWVIPAVTIARAVIIYVLIPIYNRFVKEEKISAAYQTILFWGGLRGAVPVALVLAIPKGFPGRDIIVHITLGYILFTLLFQGTTVKWLMNKLDITADKSYFDYHKGISYTLNFPTARLIDIVTSQVVSTFREEGFHIVGNETPDEQSYLFKRGQKYIALDVDNTDLTITAEQQDLAYGKQTVYETLVELDNSVSSLEELVKSDQMNEIVKDEDTDTKSSFNISKYINRNLISTHLKGKNKPAIITELVDMAYSGGHIENRDRVLDEVFERENSMSTGFENGVAIPHAKCDAADSITLVIGLKKQGVDFDSLDKKPTTLFFLIISPKSQVGPHIQLMAEIGRKMNNPTLRDHLLNASNPDEVIAVMKKRYD